MRDLGKAGEKFFSAWCAAAGMTANSSETDRNGWDVLVEIEDPSEGYDPLSMHEGLFETKIQIKSTDGTKRTIDVELSNLKKMATSTLASFYILLEFNGGESPTKAYLIHVNHSLSEKILKRVSELKSKDKNVKLNKKNMRLNFTEEILPLSAIKLKEMILAHIGPSQSTYTEKKIKHLNSVGFESGKYQFQFDIAGDEQLRKLIDISLGKNETVEVHNIFSSSLRFGTISERSELRSDTAIFAMPDIVPSETGSLVFRNKLTGRTLTFATDLYRSPFSSWVPESFRKARMVSKCFELYIGSPRKSFNITINTHRLEEFCVEEALKMFKLMQMFSSPENIRITFNFNDFTSNINVHTGESFPDCSTEIGLLEKATTLKKHFELDEPLKLTNSELAKISRQLLALDLIISNKLDVVRISFVLDESIEFGTEIDCICLCYFQIGGYALIEIMLFTGTIFNSDDEKYAIIPTQKASIYKTTAPLEIFDIHSLSNEAECAIKNHKSTRPTVNLASESLQKLKLMQQSQSVLISEV